MKIIGELSLASQLYLIDNSNYKVKNFHLINKHSIFTKNVLSSLCGLLKHFQSRRRKQQSLFCESFIKVNI